MMKCYLSINYYEHEYFNLKEKYRQKMLHSLKVYVREGEKFWMVVIVAEPCECT